MAAVDHPWQQRLGIWWIAHDHPDQMAVVSSPTGEQLTYGELAGRAHQLVRGLRRWGLVPGDIVLLVLPNGVDMVVWQLACQESGLRYVTLNPALTSSEIADIVEHSGARTVVVHVDHTDGINELLPAIGAMQRVCVGGAVAGFTPSDELIDGLDASAPPDRSLGGLITYSSGTTGKPKAVWRPLPDVDPWDFADRLKSFGQAFQFRPLVGAHLVSAGMHHGGCQGFYQGALNVGQGLVIMAKFEAQRALELIEAHQVSTAYMVPTQFVRLLRLPDGVRTATTIRALKWWSTPPHPVLSRSKNRCWRGGGRSSGKPMEAWRGPPPSPSPIAGWKSPELSGGQFAG